MPAASNASAVSNSKDVTFYEVLGLPAPSRAAPQNIPTLQDVKAAYRRALLLHHPDKTPLAPRVAESVRRETDISEADPAPKYTVDAIREAYHTLSTPSLRREYDRHLLARARGDPVKSTPTSQTTELDVWDLGDMNYDDKTQEYYERCRCGNRRGFSITEDELTEIDGTEVLLECPDCSHHVKVCFEVEEGDESEVVERRHGLTGSSSAATWRADGLGAGMQWQASVAVDGKCVVS